MLTDSDRVGPSPAARGGTASLRAPGWLRRLARDQSGVSIVEYLLLLVFLGLGVIVGVRGLAGSIGSTASELGFRVATLSPEPLSGLGSSVLPAPGERPTFAPPPPPVTSKQVADQRGRTPAEVAQWWSALTPEQRAQAIREFPAQVGSLDGVAALDRDKANRSVLEQRQEAAKDEIARLEALAVQLEPAKDRGPQPTRTQYQREQIPSELAAAKAELDKLNALAKRLEPCCDDNNQEYDRNREPKLLLGLDTSGDGRLIVAVGNPDHARHTAVYVPGLDTTLQSATGTDITRVANVQQTAESILGPGEDVSTIMYLGYDAPELNTVLGHGRANDAAPDLRKFVDGLRATHDAGPTHLTALGHSYGSTVVAQAALSGDLAVDDIVVAGSPGLRTDHASDLADPKHVWVVASPTDPVASSGTYTAPVEAVGGPVGIIGGGARRVAERFHGPNPQDPDFGANEFASTTGGHSNYYEFVNPAETDLTRLQATGDLRNQAAIVAGRYGEVGLRHGELPPDVE